MSSAPKSVRALFGIIFLDQTYITLTFPLITLLFFDPQSRLFPDSTTFATRSMWYGWCVALPNLLNLFFAPVLSALSDEFGRKKILLIEILSAGLFTFAVGCAVFYGELWLIFLGFAIKGAFARINPTALAIIGDTINKEKKILYMGYLQFAISIGAALGPALGGYLAKRFAFATFNFAPAFFIASCAALLNVGLAKYFISETHQCGSVKWQQFKLDSLKSALANPNVLGATLLLFLIQSSWSTYYQFIPPILKSCYHFNSHQLGLFIGMIAGWLALTTGLIIRFLERFLSMRKMILLSAYLVLIGFIITNLAFHHYLPGELTWIWFGAFPIAAGDVIAYSCLTACFSNAVAGTHQGKVMGLGFIIVGSVWAATGILGGFLMSISPLWPLIIAPAGAIIAILLIQHRYNFKENINLNFEKTLA